VQVHYDEGIANHIGPEPCAGIREDVGEASAGERAGQNHVREKGSHNMHRQRPERCRTQPKPYCLPVVVSLDRSLLLVELRRNSVAEAELVRGIVERAGRPH
jgi:hypothetical protein